MKEIRTLFHFDLHDSAVFLPPILFPINRAASRKIANVNALLSPIFSFLFNRKTSRAVSSSSSQEVLGALELAGSVSFSDEVRLPEEQVCMAMEDGRG
jgi:hypothetical protein